MSERSRPVPQRFRIARRWQWIAAAASGLFALACFVGWLLGYLWPSAFGLVTFLPSVWLFSVKCYNCGWPAFTDFKAEERLKDDDRFWTRFWVRNMAVSHYRFPAHAPSAVPLSSEVMPLVNVR